MDDTQAYEFYRDPANQVPAGPAHFRTGRRLSATVPVRFPQTLVDAVKRFADRDGVTVSSWIRSVVTKEVMRRQPAAVTMPSGYAGRYEPSNSQAPSTQTLAPTSIDVELEYCIA